MYSTKLIMLRICEISLTLAVFVWIQNTNLQVSLSIRGHCNMLTYIEILIFTAILFTPRESQHQRNYMTVTQKLYNTEKTDIHKIEIGELKN